jgi:hypothetical protein
MSPKEKMEPLSALPLFHLKAAPEALIFAKAGYRTNNQISENLGRYQHIYARRRISVGR